MESETFNMSLLVFAMATMFLLGRKQGRDEGFVVGGNDGARLRPGL